MRNPYKLSKNSYSMESLEQTATNNKKKISLEAKVGLIGIGALFFALDVYLALGLWERHKYDAEVQRAIDRAPLIKDLSSMDFQSKENSSYYFRLEDGGVYRMDVRRITPDGAEIGIYQIVAPNNTNKLIK